jgi:hypothetical protein
MLVHRMLWPQQTGQQFDLSAPSGLDRIALHPSVDL